MLPWQAQISCKSCLKSTFDNNSVFFRFLYHITEIHLFARASCLKDVRAHCYCASLVRTLDMTWRVHVMYFKPVYLVETQQNIELMTFAVT